MLPRLSMFSRKDAPYQDLDPGQERRAFVATLNDALGEIAPLGQRHKMLSLKAGDLQRLRQIVSAIGADAKVLGLQKLALRSFALEFRIDQVQDNRQAVQSTDFRDTFYYFLDVARQTAAQFENEGLVSLRERGPDRQTGWHILVVDASTWAADFARAALGTSCQISHAQDGSSAFDTMQAFRPDLILLDPSLDDITGQEFLETLSETPHTATVPVIVVSTDTSTEAAVSALVNGAVDFVSKGLMPEDFQTRVLSILNSGRQRLHHN